MFRDHENERKEVLPQHKMEIRDLFLRPDSCLRDYHFRSHSERQSLHFGQLKLLMSEIAFLTLFWNPEKVPEPLIVYAGAAPGDHIPLLEKMFPTMEFHLYDPRSFHIKNTARTTIFNGYFTDEEAQKYVSVAGRTYFISDIRSFAGRSLALDKMKELGIPEEEYEKDTPQIVQIKDEAFKKVGAGIWEDMEMQETWVKIMNPVFASLKMSIPYPEKEDEDHFYQYLQGQLLIQPWAPQESTETRLIPMRNDQGQYYSTQWSAREYEQLCFFHNSIQREVIQYYNPLTLGIEPIDAPELLNDYDSTAHTLILKTYVQKMGLAEANELESYVLGMSEMIMNYLNRRNKPEQRIDLNALRTSQFKQVRFYVDNVIKKNYNKSAKKKKNKNKKIVLNVKNVQHPRLSR